MRVYIACALTAVPRHWFRQYTLFLNRLALSLKGSGCGQVQYALVDSDPRLADRPAKERAKLCYRWDREMVERADVLVGEASYPSIGLGIELQIAESKSIPIVLCFRRAIENQVAPVEYENPDHSRHSLQIGDGYASLMALGLPSIVQVIGYATEDDGIRDIVIAVSTLRQRSARPPGQPRGT